MDSAQTRPSDDESVPVAGGQGERIVWSKSRNRVWIVTADETVRRTYPVSDLDEKTPVGVYAVEGKRDPSYSADEDGEVWRLDHFVRFYRRCDSCSWIGFHAIPVNDSGDLIQPVSDLGTDRSQSHGCIRQEASDAEHLYDFAQVGTRVVVVG